MMVRYNNIRKEIKSLGLTQREVADILGVSQNTLNYRIDKDKPTIHWAIYGISNYYENYENNLIIDETA